MSNQEKKPRVVYSSSPDDEMIIFLHDWARSLENEYIRRVADRFSELAQNEKKVEKKLKKLFTFSPDGL